MFSLDRLPEQLIELSLRYVIGMSQVKPLGFFHQAVEDEVARAEVHIGPSRRIGMHVCGV